MLIDCLTRHSCRWKFVKRNSLSVLMWISGGTTVVKLGGPVFTKVDRATGRCFHRPPRGVQGDPVCHSSKLVGVTLCEVAVLPEDGQPMVCYYLRWFQLQCCSSRYEVLRGVDVLLRGCGSSLQPQETAPHPLDPIVVYGEGLIPFCKEVLLLHPCRQSRFPLRCALLLLSCCSLPGR